MYETVCFTAHFHIRQIGSDQHLCDGIRLSLKCDGCYTRSIRILRHEVVGRITIVKRIGRFYVWPVHILRRKDLRIHGQRRQSALQRRRGGQRLPPTPGPGDPALQGRRTLALT